MRARRLPLDRNSQPVWVRLYLHQIGEGWAAMLVADDELPPEPGSLKGIAIFGATPEEAEGEARKYAGYSEPVN